MQIQEITTDLFDEYSENHILGNFYQTSLYGNLMNKNGYKDIYIGIYEENNLIGAALILTKTISLNVKYGYSPRGLLINYFDKDKLEKITKTLKKYFHKKGYAFIKINPIITYSEILKENFTKKINNITSDLITELEKNNLKKLKDNLYFESILPKFNPIITLKTFNFENLDKKTQNRINKVNTKGLSLVKGDLYNINTLYEFIKRKEDNTSEFYKNLYKTFETKNMIDLFFVEVNYHTYLENLQIDYNTEKTINEKINKVFVLNPKDKNIYTEKMNSDKKLNEINKEISNLNIKIQNGITKEIIATALIIKFKKIASIYTSGFNKHYSKLEPNYYLHYMLIEYYKKEQFNFMDLNGMTGDFTEDNPYKGLNEFKMSWSPRIYEYIGEFDLITNQTKYALLWSTKTLHKEFEKTGLKVTD